MINIFSIAGSKSQAVAEVLAATSHLPHMLAYALVDCLAGMQERDEIFKYAAGGFADFTGYIIVAGVHISHGGQCHGGFNDRIGPDNWGSPNDHGEHDEKVLKTVVDCCR